MSETKHLDALLAGYVKRGPAGCGMAVAQRGKIIYEGYFGMADRENGRPIDADTTYRLYSMTKVITVTAGLILFERGAFLLNEPFHAYFPEYRDCEVVVPTSQNHYELRRAQNPIRIRDAFGMTCGLPYGGGNSPTGVAMRAYAREMEARGKYDIIDFVEGMARVPLAFEPGTRWAYGHGHELVAALIQRLSGKKVGQFMQDEIFGPLGMAHTGYRWKGRDRENMAVMYRRGEDSALTPDTTRDANFAPDAVFEGGGAGLYSTVRDYLRFTQMLANGGELDGVRIIGRNTIDLMRANRLNAVQLKDFVFPYTEGYGYGLGVRVLMDQAAGNSNSTPGEFGWTGVAGTWTSIDPAHGFSAVYMHQMDPNMEEYYHLRVRAAAYGLLR